MVPKVEEAPQQPAVGLEDYLWDLRAQRVRVYKRVSIFTYRRRLFLWIHGVAAFLKQHCQRYLYKQPSYPVFFNFLQQMPLVVPSELRGYDFTDEEWRLAHRKSKHKDGDESDSSEY